MVEPVDIPKADEDEVAVTRVSTSSGIDPVTAPIGTDHEKTQSILTKEIEEQHLKENRYVVLKRGKETLFYLALKKRLSLVLDLPLRLSLIIMYPSKSGTLEGMDHTKRPYIPLSLMAMKFSTKKASIDPQGCCNILMLRLPPKMDDLFTKKL
ncbi:hypothetical protein GOBAR_DD18588 [Gossypium barbadense]|nr:hypothetical protein GOBAR_DD18588 [Gossypium barbadense]